ncbi:hypothetical protein OGATHE_006101 [Ogataea polymorpha]|uniref:Uncharacterized protein n=1 Tax=Ogataea polymorpha TaxID=460523 RepID=A0A9P8NU31_9ASCO|nr:hypothetical protein OGATHE_006101 [Ogataea polymorpha]
MICDTFTFEPLAPDRAIVCMAFAGNFFIVPAGTHRDTTFDVTALTLDCATASRIANLPSSRRISSIRLKNSGSSTLTSRSRFVTSAAATRPISELSSNRLLLHLFPSSVSFRSSIPHVNPIIML